MEHDAAFHVADTCNGIALLISLRITTAHEHHTHGGALVELHLMLVEVARSNAVEKVDDVALQAQHHALRLGVTHAAVVFYDVRIALATVFACWHAVHQSEEDEAFVVDALGSQAFHGGTDDAFFHLLHPLLRSEGHGCDASHAARVQTRVALADALVVLGFGQNLIVLTVGEHKHRALHAAEILLDDHAAGGIAKHAAEHLAQFALRLVERGQDENALAGAEAVGLQHVGCLQGFEEGDALLHVFAVEGLVAGCGNVVTLHESLSEILRTFEHGTSLRRANNGNMARALIAAEVVVDAAHQRILRTYHHHIDAIVGSKSLQRLKVVHADGHILAHLACAGIAGSDV